MTSDPRQEPASPSVESMMGAVADIGRSARTGGYSRFAWSDTDLTLREWFVAEAEVRGLTVEEDRAGNQFAWLGDPDGSSNGANVVIGSHLDSVPDGGAFDGPLGVISAFLALDRVRPSWRAGAPALAVANFAEEEGARFGVACLGSRMLTGQLSADQALRLTDSEGVSLAEATRMAGRPADRFGRDEVAAGHIGCFIELHIEQGRHLDPLGVPIGIGSGIWPHGRWRYDYAGSANHAGTTSLADRQDPMLQVATTVLAARAAAQRLGGLATVGRVSLWPNAVNAIPASATAWLDARAPDEPTLRALVALISESAGCNPTAESLTDAIDLDANLVGRIRATLPHAPIMRTGAGHDAGVLALAGIPTAMLFVRNPTGVSHSPQEQATMPDCAAGVDALASVITALACLANQAPPRLVPIKNTIYATSNRD